MPTEGAYYKSKVRILNERIVKLKAEIERLQGIIDRAAKTRDGVPMIGRMTIYRQSMPGTGITSLLLSDNSAFADWWSTHEAAEAANDP